MLLLLVMYSSPFLAALLFWRTQKSAALAGEGLDSNAGGDSAWDVLSGLARTRALLVRPAAGAFALLALVVGASCGPTAAVAATGGAAMAAFLAAMAHASAGRLVARASSPSPGRLWSEAADSAVAQGAVATGCLGGLAWFFADSSGAPVLAAFAAGTGVGALFVELVVPSGYAAAVAAPLRTSMTTFCAALLAATTAPAEQVLPLGGLLSETETLRSELLLLPLALVLLAPLAAAAAAPLVASLVERRGGPALESSGRIGAFVSLLAAALLVALSGLSWVLVAAFAAGLAAREAAFALESLETRTSRLAGSAAPVLAPALAALVFLFAHALAGAYGVAIAAAGMAATWVTSVAARSAGVALARDAAAEGRAAESCSDSTSALALLAVAAPAVIAQSARDGIALEPVVVAAPALLAGALAGAAFAAAFVRRLGAHDSEDEREAVTTASRAVVAAAAVPLVGLVLGPGGAVGVALGALAATAAMPPEAAGGPPAVAWAATLAMTTLVAVPLAV